MGGIENYRAIIKRLLLDKQAQFRPFAPQGALQFCALDDERDQYLLINTGWHGARRQHGATLYLRIENGKVWIEEDWTDDGVVSELIAMGVDKEDIVLGFQPPSLRAETELVAA